MHTVSKTYANTRQWVCTGALSLQVRRGPQGCSSGAVWTPSLGNLNRRETMKAVKTFVTLTSCLVLVLGLGAVACGGDDETTGDGDGDAMGDGDGDAMGDGDGDGDGD